MTGYQKLRQQTTRIAKEHLGSPLISCKMHRNIKLNF